MLAVTEKASIPIAHQLLQAGADINVRDEHDMSPLLVAARSGPLEMMNFLIEKGADARAKSRRMTALHAVLEASSQLQAEMILALINADVDLEARNLAGETALRSAMKHKYFATAELLLRHGAVPEAEVIKTLCFDAMDHGSDSAIELFLKKYTNVEGRDNDDGTLLHIAVRYGRESFTQMLLERGANIEVRNDWGCTPLCMAVRCGRDSITKMLLARGAEIEASNSKGYTPLYIAARFGRESITIILLERGADIEAINHSGFRPLYGAVAGGHISTLQLLLDCGADLSTTLDHGNPRGGTLLHCAIQTSNLTIVEALVMAGADVNSRDFHGNTPLHDAVWLANEGQGQIATLLLEKGAQLRATDCDGNTPLHTAVLCKSLQFIRLLLSHHPSSEVQFGLGFRNAKGESAFKLFQLIHIDKNDLEFEAWMDAKRVMRDWAAFQYPSQLSIGF